MPAATKPLGENLTRIRSGQLPRDLPRAAEVCLLILRQYCAGARAEPSNQTGLAGSGVLSHILVAKLADHVPFYPQSVMDAREGAELQHSSVAMWGGHRATLTSPCVGSNKTAC